MNQVNTPDGYVVVAETTSGNQTLGVCNMADKAGASIELTRDKIVSVREVLWDAIRKNGRGYDINIEDVLNIEEVRHKPRYSVTGYAEEIEWTIRLLQTHLRRVALWKEEPEEDRGMLGKLDEFLSQFEEM
jgi:hypothetical protein